MNHVPSPVPALFRSLADHLKPTLKAARLSLWIEFSNDAALSETVVADLSEQIPRITETVVTKLAPLRASGSPVHDLFMRVLFVPAKAFEQQYSANPARLYLDREMYSSSVTQLEFQALEPGIAPQITSSVGFEGHGSKETR